MDKIFRLLSDKDRRRLLVALLDHHPHSDDRIVIPEDIQRGDPKDRRRHVRMVHNHLPMLADAEVIRWDRETNEIHQGPRFEELRPVLELLTDHADDLPGEWI